MKRAAAAVLLLTLLCTVTAAEAQQQTDRLISPIKTTSDGDRSTTLTAPAALKGSALRPGAVTVTENKVLQQASVVRLPAERLEVVLVIDTSASMKGAALTSAKAAASDFISHLPQHTRVAVVSFGSRTALSSPLAEDHAVATRAIAALRATGATALYDALRLATNQFSSDAGSRHSMVVLSDGRDTVSSAKLKATTSAIKTAGAHVDVIELVTKDGDPATLGHVAAAGAGRVAAASDPSALAGIYEGIATSLANQYTVKWRTALHGPVNVVVSVRQDGVVAQSQTTLDPAAATAKNGPAGAEHVATWKLVVGVSCVALAVLLFGLMAFAPGRGRRRSVVLGSARTSYKDVSVLSGVVGRATASADAVLTRHGWRGTLNDRLEQAGVALRPGEYAVMGLSAVVVAFALGALLGGFIVGLLFAAVAAAVAHVALGIMRSRRRAKFSDQLGDTLQQLAGSLRAGYGLLQAVDGLARESSEPTSGEFRRLVVEARLGRDVSSSLHAMADRIGTDDFEWVVQAIDIHREVGGDLAEVLDTVAGTIRERNQVLRQVKSLTAEGKLSAYILLALPIVLAAALKLINPTYFVLLTSGVGLVLAGTSVVMLGLGALWFHKLCKLEY